MQNDDQNNQNLPQDSGLPTQQQPTTPVSTPAKEVEPISADFGKPSEKYIEVSEKEPQVRPEVEKAGVYKVSDKLKLDKEARDAGLTEAKESTPVSTSPTGKVVLPLTREQAKIDEKGDSSNSITWLAKLILFYLKKLGGSNG